MSKIVFCENERLMQKLFRAFLSSAEHEIYVASDGIEGLEIIKREHPDLILTDIDMPRCDGFELARALKACPDLAATPIIFVTAFVQKYDMEEAARYSPIGYLVKPFVAADLQTTITAALANQKQPQRSSKGFCTVR